MFRKFRGRWLTVAGLAAGCVTAGGLIIGSPAAADPIPPTISFQAGPFPVGNMLSYANSDFEQGVTPFVDLGNATISNSTATSVMHRSSILDTVSESGVSEFALRENPFPDLTRINLKAGGTEYTIGAYFKVDQASGQSVVFSLDLFDGGGTEIGKLSTPKLALNASGGWQYVQGYITGVPANAAYVLQSPDITLSGMSAGERVYMDDLLFEPTRAATAIGARGDNCQTVCTEPYSATDWTDSGSIIGPLQSDKEFFSPSSKTGGELPSSFQDTNCYGIEQMIGTDQRHWPICVLVWTSTAMTQDDMNNFLASVPSGQELYLVWFNEPELPTNSGPLSADCPQATVGESFKCEFGIQEGLVKRSKGYTANIFTAMNAAGSRYSSPDCSYIPPSTDADIYLVDLYEFTVDGNSVSANSERGNDWNNWLSCVTPENRPIGIGEYGLDQSTTTNVQNTPDAMFSDTAYLESLSATIHEPVALWEYWWSDCGGQGCGAFWQFSDSDAITTWQAIERQNGGG